MKFITQFFGIFNAWFWTSFILLMTLIGFLNSKFDKEIIAYVIIICVFNFFMFVISIFMWFDTVNLED